ncbi:MAG: YitT family protein [Treponema sp.]|nr:YitT family protein [Treponema sp.]
MTVTSKSVLHTARRLALVTLGAVLMAFNIKTFIHAGGLIPGGFTGLTLLIQEICHRFFHLHVPFSVVLYILNSVPAFICFRYVGKKFTLYSVYMVFLSGLMTDFMPAMFINAIKLHDTLLSAVFGGILNAVAIILCLIAGATSGGTDFIAIYFSEKHRKDAWNYIFIGNFAILAIAGALFTLEKALYSIIFQFTATIVLNSMYHAYQQKTLLIITSHPVEVYKLIREKTNHAATSINVTGLYDRQERKLLYSVVYSNEVTHLINAIHRVDPGAFINVIKTEQINGRFFKKPKD